MRYRILKPTVFKPFTKKVYGFDIETYGQKNIFYCATIYYDDKDHWTFYDRRELIDFLKTKRFKDSYISATNLMFDFYGVFRGTPEELCFRPIFRASSLLSLKSWIKNKEFIPQYEKSARTVTFIDTLNYARMSVEALGEMLGVPKLEHPSFLGQRPKDDQERIELETYNIRDAEISKKAIEFFYSTFSRYGASPKITIASTSMSLFRNNYLNKSYFGHDMDKLDDQFSSYYGGRTEVFARGRIKDYFYYDYNSLYPSQMVNELPDPNTVHVIRDNSVYYIEHYEGISHVLVNCPRETEYPVLPYRYNGKLIFPTGTFRGWYTHLELRRAMELGYTIMHVYKTQYYKETCRPFRRFVEDLYERRKDLKSRGDPMQLVIKLLMNSLYGKFAQKYKDRDEFRPEATVTRDELRKLTNFQRIEKYFRYTVDGHPSCFCFPIWPSYITAYGRIKLHDAISRYKAIYCDTDSLLTKANIPSSKDLGKLELEKYVTEGIIVKPKFYAVKTATGKNEAKVKGAGVRMTYKMFMRLLQEGMISYKKFVKFRESLRRNLDVNEIIDITKNFDLEDDKRRWVGKFNPERFERSVPIDLLYDKASRCSMDTLAVPHQLQAHI